MHGKTGDFSILAWWSEANLSLFLLLLVLLGFVFPSLGVEKNNLPLYSDIAFSIVLIVGAVVASGNRQVARIDGTRGRHCVRRALDKVVDANEHDGTLERHNGGHSGHNDCPVLARVPPRSRHLDARARRHCGLPVSRVWLGARLPHRRVVGPGAFSTTGSEPTAVSTWANYSFGMLTTLGYEGISPVHPVAHTLGTGEAVTGQLYLAVLVARLVSAQVSSAQQHADE